MWYCILCAIILIAVGIIIEKFMDDDYDTAVMIGSLLFIVMVFAPITNCFIGVQGPIEYQQEKYTITGLELVSNENSSLSEKFILGTGKISGSSNTELKYVFFANTQYGKQLMTTNTKNIYLKETDDETPKIIEIRQKTVRKTNWIDYLWGTKEEEVLDSDELVGEIVIVPTNTIKIDYNIKI